VPIKGNELTVDEEDLAEKMQVFFKFFIDLLQVTGYLIEHRWKKGLPSLLWKRASHGGIDITSNYTGQTTGIKRKAATQGHITFGFHLTCDGTSSAHKKIMKSKVKEYSKEIISSILSRGKGLLAYNSYCMEIL
jgi:hypothetical protein